MSHTFYNDENTTGTQLGVRVCPDTRVSVFCRIRRLTDIQESGIGTTGWGAQRWWWSTVLLGLAEARADFRHFSKYLLSGPSCCPSGSRL